MRRSGLLGLAFACFSCTFILLLLIGGALDACAAGRLSDVALALL